MRRIGMLVSVCLATMMYGNLSAQEEVPKKPKVTTKEVMKLAHKKPKQLLRKVAQGGATAKERQELFKLYTAMAANKPPKGDTASWKEKTTLLVEAAKAAVDGNEGAGKELTKAANCKDCHGAHKK